MQTKAIIVSSALSTLASAAAIVANKDMPTLGGPAWYDVAPSGTALAAYSTPVPSSWTAASVQVAPSSSTPAQSWTAASVPTPAAVVSSSSHSYENPFTIYTTMTNEWGVITGMPAVVTSQPAVVTSQPTQPIPAGVTPSSSLNTTLAIATKSSTESFQQTRTASALVATHTGAAATHKVGAAGLALAGLAVAFALL